MAEVYTNLVFVPKSESVSLGLVPTTEEEAWIVSCMPGFRISGFPRQVGKKITVLPKQEWRNTKQQIAAGAFELGRSLAGPDGKVALNRQPVFIRDDLSDRWEISKV